MSSPIFRLHSLKGALKTSWSCKSNAVTFGKELKKVMEPGNEEWEKEAEDGRNVGVGI